MAHVHVTTSTHMFMCLCTSSVCKVLSRTELTLPFEDLCCSVEVSVELWFVYVSCLWMCVSFHYFKGVFAAPEALVDTTQVFLFRRHVLSVCQAGVKTSQTINAGRIRTPRCTAVLPRQTLVLSLTAISMCWRTVLDVAPAVAVTHGNLFKVNHLKLCTFTACFENKCRLRSQR